jgi:pterin-4a-carbinolamine dehydratase
VIRVCLGKLGPSRKKALQRYQLTVRFDIWTHAINGLSENDFILAAKIDALK